MKKWREVLSQAYKRRSECKTSYMKTALSTDQHKLSRLRFLFATTKAHSASQICARRDRASLKSWDPVFCDVASYESDSDDTQWDQEITILYCWGLQAQWTNNTNGYRVVDSVDYGCASRVGSRGVRNLLLLVWKVFQPYQLSQLARALASLSRLAKQSGSWELRARSPHVIGKQWPEARRSGRGLTWKSRFRSH